MTEYYDPDPHREPTARDESDAHVGGFFRDGARVCMIGTDLYGTVVEGNLLAAAPLDPLVEWDQITPEEGEESRVSPDLLVLVAVPR